MAVTFYGRGQVWDPDAQKVLCKFVGGSLNCAGTLTTNDPALVAKLTALGYQHEGAVTEGEPVALETPVPVLPADNGKQPPPDDLDDLTVSELTDRAVAVGLDFPPGAKKAEKVAMLRTHLAARG